MQKYTLLLLSFFLVMVYDSDAQNVQFSADNIEGLTDGLGRRLRRLTGNVVFKQTGRTLYSQQADQFLDEDRMIFKGGVRIEQDNGATITGDSLVYATESKKAKIMGNVLLIDKSMTLYTNALEYDMNSGMAIYRDGGEIVDGGNKLTSIYGRFDRANDKMYFQGNVFLADGESEINTDSLEYFNKTGNALFFGKTRIVNKEGTIYSTKGSYNTKSKKGSFKGKSRIETSEYIIDGDSIQFDRVVKRGSAKGNVVLFEKSDSLVITGEKATFSDREGKSKIFGKPLLKYPMKSGDTLMLTADTLFTEDQNKTDRRKLRAYHHARFLMNDIQGICDSLIYSFQDSLLRFYHDPVIWSGENQISADTIFAQMAQKELDKMFLRYNAFIIAKDTLQNFNQMKGKNMTALFWNNQIKKLNVYGNAQSIYFALENDTVLMGMNKISSTDIVVLFEDKNKLSKIKALNQPEGIFYPPHEIEEPEKKLKGFRWRATERPTKSRLLTQADESYKKTQADLMPNMTNKKASGKTKRPQKKSKYNK